MKIRKCVSAITAAVVLIVLSLSDALAAVSTVNSPLTEPVPSFISGNVDTYHLYWVCQFQDSYIGEYDISCKNFMFDITATCSHGSQLYYKVGDAPNRFYYVLCPSNVNFSLSVSAIDLETGLLIFERSTSRSVRDGSNYVISVLTSGDFSGSHLEGSFVIQEGMQNINSNATLVNPFVIWSFKPPDHNVYHSHLSEPTSDKYNRYFVVDDRLYWISCQLNGFYIRQDVIESTSRIGSFQQMIGDSGSGWNSVNLSGVWYVPVDILSLEFSDDLPFYLTLVPSQNEIKVVLQPYDFVNVTNNVSGQYYLQASFYISEFNLADGSYVTSVFQEFNQSISVSQYLNFSLSTGASIHCYGINFYNILNLPYNLSDVQWEYDLEFVTWRDQMLQQLQQIYALLSSSDSVPETTTYQNFGAEVASGEPSFSDLNAEDVKFQLDQAAGAAADLQPASNTVKGWISDFMPFKLMIPVIFALAFGVVILILGKNKSDT